VSDSEGATIVPIGRVVSVLTDPATAPRQGDEGAPPAGIILEPGVRAAAAGISPGDRLVVLTWLHLADRTVLRVHPRGDRDRPEAGVFTTRSPDRPNPIGLHTVTVTAVADGRIDVDALEAVDGTPVLDIKPVLGDVDER
jgi:tRNA-Thr(GGU) m(6)t(6)A37 methyltransferase TsaA